MGGNAMRQKSWYLTIGTGLTACMLAFTALAMATTCSSLSTEQGPAIMVRFPPPI